MVTLVFDFAVSLLIVHTKFMSFNHWPTLRICKINARQKYNMNNTAPMYHLEEHW